MRLSGGFLPKSTLMALSRENSYFVKVLNLCPTTRNVTLPGYCYLSKLADRKWLADYGRKALKKWPTF